MGQAEENISHSIFRSISDGLIVVDQTGKITDLNVAATYALGITAKDSIGKNFAGQLNNKQLESELTNLFDEPDIYSVNRFIIEFSSLIFAVNFDPIFSSKKERIGVLIVLHDVTEERKLLSAKDEFLYAASHELYTPLTELRWNLELIRDSVKDVKDEELKTSVDDANTGFGHIFKIAQDLLDIAAAETGRAEFSNHEFDLTALTGAVVEKFRKSAEDKKLEIVKKIAPTKARGDEVKTTEIVAELLENAIKFSDKGSIGVEVSSGERAVVTVSDQGIGIDKALAENLFIKFGRLGSVLKDHRGGLGLGLYKAKLYAEAMGGAVKLESSEPGKGSTFVLELLK